MKYCANSPTSITTFSRIEKKKVDGIDVSEILELFSILGYDCEIDAMVTGLSGTKHHFDIVARKGPEVLVIDIVAFRRSLLDTIASDEESDEQILLTAVQMRAMAWDCQAYHAIILHLNSSLSREEGKTIIENKISLQEDINDVSNILRRMKIELIRSSDIHGVIPKFKRMLCATEEVA